MKDLKGKTAFITGGASGIGLAMAEAFGRAAMNVMLADIEAKVLEASVEKLREMQIRAEGVVTDVARRNAIQAAADETVAKFGKVHIVCNNAGVAVGGPVGAVAPADWDWIIDVNLKSVVYGVEIFTPLMETHGEGGHFVNTASMAGMISPPLMEPYCATKFAVVAMSEGWAGQLGPRNIGVSVLCPGFVRTRIHESRRNRQSDYGPDAAAAAADLANGPVTGQAVLSGIPPEAVGARVLEAVLANELYIFTHVELKEVTAARFQRILDAFEASKASPALSALPPREVPAIAQN
jgi:NAD(P)-dependent dehydrogenase (short-subunit alcohol dehydrogenase family)